VAQDIKLDFEFGPQAVLNLTGLIYNTYVSVNVYATYQESTTYVCVGWSLVSILFRMKYILTYTKILGIIFGIVCWGNIRERDHLEDPNRRIFRKWDGGTDWINLAQERDR
jgi:hypothetical protein